MPELPEVETIKRYLERAGIAGERMASCRCFWNSTLVCRGVQGQVADFFVDCTIRSVHRRGKYLVLSCNEERYILMHLRMSGRIYYDDDHALRPHERVSFLFVSGKQLHFCDARKFGRITLAHSLDILKKLGPEPWDASLTARSFYCSLQRRSTRIKPLLLNQHFLAGLGNIYCDESLWRAQIHPAAPASSLSEAQAERLLSAIRKVLSQGIENAGTSLGHGAANFVLPQGEAGRNREALSVYGQQGLPCCRCGTTLVKTIVAQRGTHFCPHCQVAPRD